MANPYFENRLDYLGQRKKELDSRTVQLQIPGYPAFDIDATIGKTSFAETSTDGMVVSYDARDYVVDVADLAAAGVTEPPRGTRVIDGNLVGELMSTSMEGMFRYTTQTRKRLRMHFKVVHGFSP